MTTRELYDSYRSRMRLIADIRNASAVLQWDQETNLPLKGASFRGQQISTLSEISHKYFSDPELGNLLNDLVAKDDLSPEEKRNVSLTLEDYEKNKKYTATFVRALSDQVNKAFHSWIEARKQNRFSVFEKDLDKLIQLKKEEAALLGYSSHPYDALLNEYEKGCTVALLDESFAKLLPALRELLSRIAATHQVDDSFLRMKYPKQEQWEWGMYLLKELHYDLEAGRQDLSEHPFSISFNPSDVRVTTRVDENDFGNMTWSCIHEAGHALYEQGLPESEYGLPLGEACSYSIHESQSRLWENNVGRSSIFWQHYYAELQKRFSSQLGKIPLENFYKGINRVEPSLVRTEADEITYHFHVFIRYELEKKLIENSIVTADIPQFWNSRYRELMGVDVPNDKKGCLQDVHWSHGSFGYFPTYSLGSLYAAQFFQAAKKALPDLESEIGGGNLKNLLNWLRINVHSKGRFQTSEGLCREVTGKPLDANCFVTYLLDKYGTIYTL